MPCDASLNNIDPGAFSPFPGLDLAPIQVPFPNIDIPTDLLEDLLDLINSLGLLFPSGLFKPNIDDFTQELMKLISNLLTQIAPFLSFYNFIMALFKLILCIIEVLCAIPNPFKIATAMVKLFTECLPPFLNLFPWLALIAMIIALILLIIALIEYIIAVILAIIEEIIRNILILKDGLSFQDATSTLAAIQKIAELTCLIQNILAIFVALAAIIAIIQSLTMIGGAPVCDDETPGGCCSPDVCPPFIKNSPWEGTQGTLIYDTQVGLDIATMFSSLGLPDDQLALFAETLAPLRQERWQLFDSGNSGAYPFSDITTPILDTSILFPPTFATFWPEGLTFTSDTPATKTPYNIDLRFEVNPSDFDMQEAPTNTLSGRRYMTVKDCIVVRKPINVVLNYAGLPDFTQGSNGVLQIEGGSVFEDDGTAFMIIPTDPFAVTPVDGYLQATLNDFIHKPDSVGTVLTNETVTITNVEYTFKPVYGTLMAHTLITAGCLPEVAAEKAIMNAVIVAEDIRAVVDKLAPVPIGTLKGLPSLGILPNIEGAQQCVLDSLNSFRANLSIETAALFQADVEGCLGDLKEQSLAVVCGAIAAAASQFKSAITLDIDTQFTSRSIRANVVLKDANDTSISGNVPVGCRPDLENKMIGEVTLGKITSFTFDPGTGSYDATITSDKAGDGELTVVFNGKVLSKLVPATDESNTQIAENTIPYTFIAAPEDPAVRRDATDVASASKE